MKSSVVVLMTLAVFGFSGAAFAGQATKPAAMSDAEMDKVTAGATGGVQGPNDNFGQLVKENVSHGQGGWGPGGSGGNCQAAKC
jgi:hypothetical protein